MATDVGFIGLGIMGSRQAANLHAAGYGLTVHNRTRATAEAWAAERDGVTVADTPREVAERCRHVVCMVVDAAQVEAVLLGEDGAVRGAREGAVFVDMSTIGPGPAVAIGQALAEHGVGFVDAPVTGSAPKAADGTLTIMVGGADEHVDAVAPLFEAMGELIVRAGPSGQGQAVKVINQAVAAVNCATVAQALVVGRRTGVDLDALVEVMGAGSGGSKMLELKAGPMLAHDFDPLFKLAHMLKDVRLCLDAGAEAEVPFPAAAAAGELYTAALARGLGDRDFAAVLEAVEGLAGARL